jgi:hypothetical protein
VAAEREDAAVMAVEDDLERRLGAAPDLLHEAVVGGEAQQARGDRPWSCARVGTWGSRRFHSFIIGDAGGDVNT